LFFRSPYKVYLINVVTLEVIISCFVHIFQLLEECYKILETLHGSRYVAKLDEILEGSLCGFKPEPAESSTSQHQENILSGTRVACSKQLTASIADTDCESSEIGSVPPVSVKASSSAKQECLNLQISEKSFRHVVKCDDKCNVTVTTENPAEACGKKVNGVALTCRALPSKKESCKIHAEGQPIEKYSCKPNSYIKKPKYADSEFTEDNHSDTFEERRLCSCLYEAVSRSTTNEGSEMHVALLESKMKISVDNNETVHITFSSNSNDNCPDTSDISTNSHNFCTPNLPENLTYSRNDLPCVKDVIREHSIPEKLEDKNGKSHYSFLQPSKVQNASVLSLGLQCNNREELPEQQTSPVPEPLHTRFMKIEAIPLKNYLHANEFEEESDFGSHEANRVDHGTHVNIEDKCVDNISLLSNEVQKYGNITSNGPSFMTKCILFIEETAAGKSCISEQLPRHKPQSFISSYDLGCLSMWYEPQFPVWKESSKMDEIYNHYEPMNQSVRRNCHKEKAVCLSESVRRNCHKEKAVRLSESVRRNCHKEKAVRLSEPARRNCHKEKAVHLSESVDCKISDVTRTECISVQKTHAERNTAFDYCGNTYEECRPRDTSDVNADRTLSAYDVPLYQVCGSQSVSFQLFMFSSIRLLPFHRYVQNISVLHMKLAH
jgi:hypothetical protein